MIEVVFTETVTSITAAGLFQWDYGQELRIKGISMSTVSEVHFSNSKEKEALVVPAVDQGEYITCQIPDVLLTKNVDIIAYIYDIQSTSGETVRTITLKVEARPKPANFNDQYEDAEVMLEDVVNLVNQQIASNAQFKTEMEQAQEDFEEEITQLVGQGLIDDDQVSTGLTWSSSKTQTEINSAVNGAKTELQEDIDQNATDIGTLETTVSQNTSNIATNTQSINTLNTTVLKKTDIADTSEATDKLWSSSKIASEIETLSAEITSGIADSRKLKVQVDFTIASYTTNTEKEGTDLAYYADVDCTGANPSPGTGLTMDADITPDPDVTTPDDKGLLTYTDIVESNKVRCYFSEQPASPYKIMYIDLEISKTAQDLQPASVQAEVQNAYTAAKLAKQAQVLEAQQAAVTQLQEDLQTEYSDITTVKADVATLKADNEVIKTDIQTINDTVEDRQEVDVATNSQIISLMSVGYAQTMSYVALGNDPQPYAGTYASQAPEFEYGKEYAKGDLFQFNGQMGFVKQAHTSQETWVPFTQGTEALYGARPCPVNGVYPWTYNMAVEKGMKVSYEGVTYEAIQDAPDCIWTPDTVPAIFKVVE